MNLPLTNRIILVTRAKHQAGKLSSELKALGAEVLEIPAIEIVPPDSYAPLDDALRNLKQYPWLIVTSANTVHVLRERAESLEVFAHLRVAAIGNATAQALSDAGIQVTLTPKEYVAESLLAELGNQLRNQKVLIARSAIARDIIPESLRQLGAEVDAVDAYQTIIPRDSVKKIQELFQADSSHPDAVTFTSSSSVTNFLALLKEAKQERRPVLKAISIGPITSKTLRDNSWEPAAEAKEHNIAGLVQAVLCALSTVS